MELFVKYKLLIGVIAAIGLCGAVFYWFYCVRSSNKTFSFGRRQFHVPTDGVKKVVLDNGMTLLMYKNTSQPKVVVQIAYNIGSYIEQEGERGLAHLLEHMIFKGTQKLSESDLDEIARKYGASYNAFTSMDVTSYYFEVDKNNWQPFLNILSDCMQNARFDEQHLNSELKAVLQELKMNRDAYWNMMFQKICAVVFPANHPYHNPIIGYKEDLMNISAARVKEFYKKYYQPNRATLFVVGDIDHDEVISQVKANFAHIPSAHAPITREFIELPPALSTVSVRTYEDIKSEQLGFFWRMPGRQDPQELVGEAAAFLLGHGEGSRLHRRLVDDKKVAASVSVYAYTFMGAGIFWILIEPLAGKIDECRALVIEELNKAAEKGFTPHELEHMIRAQAKGFFHGLQKYTGIAYEWIESFFATGDEYEFFRRADRFASVSSAQVQEFIKTHLDPLVMNQIDVVPLPASLVKISENAKHQSDEMDRKILAKYVRTAPVEAAQFALHMPPPHALDFVFPKPDRMLTLPNGLTLIMRQNAALPIISVDCKFKEHFYLSSSKESPAVGLMMNTLIEGSEGFDKNANVDFFELYGADYGYGVTGGALSMLNDESEKLLARFVHVLAKPTFPADAIEKLKVIQLDSFNRALDEPTQVAIKLLKSKVYAGHPFGWTFEEAIEITKKLDGDALKALHKQLVAPNNMVLSIVGDFDVDAMQAIVERVCAQWKPGTEYGVVYPERVAPVQGTFDVPMVRDQVVLLMGQPSPINFYHEDLIPARLLNYIMFQSLGSRLFMLREQSGLFYTAFGQLAAGAGQEKGFDYVGALLSPENVVKSETLIKELLEQAATGNITETELEGAKRLYLKTLLDLVASNGSVAGMMGTLHTFKLGFDYYDRALARTQALTITEINQIAQRYCSAQNMMRVRVGRMPAK
jgi:zinc protease